MLSLFLHWGSWEFYLYGLLYLIGVDYSFRSYDFKCLHDSYWPVMFHWHLCDRIDMSSSDLLVIPKCLAIFYGGRVCFIACPDWLTQNMHLPIVMFVLHVFIFMFSHADSTNFFQILSINHIIVYPSFELRLGTCSFNKLIYNHHVITE